MKGSLIIYRASKTKTKSKARDSWILILETTRKMGQNEYNDKVY